MTACRTAHPRSGGFSLVEMLVVLAVLALAAAVTLPSLTGGRAAEQRAAARTVAAALRQARTDAITRAAESVLRIDVEQRLLELPRRGVTRRLPDWLPLALYTAETEMLDEQRGAIRFFPDGSSTGGRVTVGDASTALLVDVEWLTGRVRILAPGEAGTDDAEARAGIASSVQ